MDPLQRAMRTSCFLTAILHFYTSASPELKHMPTFKELLSQVGGQHTFNCMFQLLVYIHVFLLLSNFLTSMFCYCLSLKIARMITHYPMTWASYICNIFPKSQFLFHSLHAVPSPWKWGFNSLNLLWDDPVIIHYPVSPIDGKPNVN